MPEIDYLTAAISAATGETGNFEPGDNRLLAVKKEKEIIPIMSENLPDVNIPGVANVSTLGKETIQKSELNTILDYDNFQMLIAKINADNKKEFQGNWASIPKDKSYFHPNLLKHSYNISHALVQGRITGNPAWDKIQNEMIQIFKIVLSLNIKSSNEIPLYSILTANQTLFENNPTSKLDLFESTFWEMFLIPVMLKQDQLLGIKFIEFWMYLGVDFNFLFQELLSTKIIIPES